MAQRTTIMALYATAIRNKLMHYSGEYAPDQALRLKTIISHAITTSRAVQTSTN